MQSASWSLSHTTKPSTSEDNIQEGLLPLSHLGLSTIKDIITDHRPGLPVSLPHDLWEESQGLKQEFNVGSLSLLEITEQAAAGVRRDYISSGKEPIAFIRD